jgi:hypothetical protein
MQLEDKDYYWFEMSHYVYPVLSQKERLELEYREYEYEFLNRYYDENKCVKFVYGEG